MRDHKHVGPEGQLKPSTWLTPKDVQAELRLGERAVYRLLKSGAIPNVRLGGVYRINRKSFEEAMLAPSGLGKTA